MMQKTWMVLAVAAALSACGGGGGAGGVSSGSSGTGSSSGGSAAAELSGKVVDGYLQGAEVCLDTNADKVCDTAKAITDANGSYRLTHTLTAEQLASAHVLVVVPETAKDADDGGKTLKEAGKAAFELLAPAAKPQVVSPLTTLVSERMISNRQSVADAESSVAGTLKLDNGTPLLGASADFVAGNKADLKQLAQTTAVLLGEVKKVVTNTVSGNAGIVKPAEQQRIEVDAVREMMRKIVEGNQLAQLGTGQKIDPKKVQDLLGSTLATDAANLKDSAQLAKKVTELTPPPATFNISQLLGLPLFNVEVDSQQMQVNVCTDSMSSSLLTNICYVSYKVNGAWQPWVREENGMELTSQGVVPTNTETPYKLSPDTATTFQMQDFVPKLHSATYTLRTQGPRSPSAVFKDVSFAESDVAYPMSIATNPGTQAYEYAFNANYPRTCGGSAAGSIDCTTFAQLRSFYDGSVGYMQFNSYQHKVVAAFDGTKLALFHRPNFPNFEKLPVAGSWTERKVASVDLMDVTVPDEYKAQAGLEAGQQPFFIVYQGKVYQGNRRDIKKYEWTWLNKSAFEKVRQFYKLPVLVK